MKTTKAVNNEQNVQDAQSVLVMPNEAVKLNKLVEIILNQFDSITTLKQSRPIVNAYLTMYIQEYGYKDVLNKCREILNKKYDDRRAAALKDLTFNNVLNAVAPLVFNTDAFRQITTDALRAGALKYNNPVDFCRQYCSAVTSDGVILVTQSYVYEDATNSTAYICSKYVAKNLTHKVATALLEQALTNYNNVAKSGAGLHKGLNNIRIIGTRAGSVYKVEIDGNGRAKRGAVVDGADFDANLFSKTLSEHNADLAAKHAAEVLNSLM